MGTSGDWSKIDIRALVACRSEVVTDEGAFRRSTSISGAAQDYRASPVSSNVISATGH
jgi:hypothetical protein